MLIKKLSNDQKTFSNLMGGTLDNINKVANIMVHYHMITKSCCKQLADSLNLGLKAINNIKGMPKEIPRVMVRDYLMANPKCSNHVHDMMMLHCQRMDNCDKAFNPLLQNLISTINTLRYHSNDASALTNAGKSLSKAISNARELLDVKSSDGMPKNALIVIK